MKWEKFIKESLCYEKIDREKIKTREIMLDGEAYSEFNDPIKWVADHMNEEIAAYKSKQSEAPDLLPHFHSVPSFC